VQKKGNKMGKYSQQATPTVKQKNTPKPKSPISTKSKSTIQTALGGDGYKRDAKSELFLLGVSLFAGENQFHESGVSRDERFKNLVQKVTKNDPEWVKNFLTWLRGPEANIRSATIMGVGEYIAAGGPNGRELVADALQRADEPAELLSYWMINHYGWDGMTYPYPAPKIPQALRKGLSDSCQKLFTANAAIKYKAGSKGEVGMGNVLNLIHAKAKDTDQAKVFDYIIDKHHGNPANEELLPQKAKVFSEVWNIPQAQRRERLSTELIRSSGMTWEQLSGWLNGPMDKQAWEAVIPTMGYMALLRNLRNFDEAKIGTSAVNFVRKKLSSPEEVKSSRQLPFRFYNAYHELSSDKWTSTLSDALDLSLQNVPELSGKTLVLVDVSGSMGYGPSGRGRSQLWEIASLFGIALGRASENADVYAYSTGHHKVKVDGSTSVLRTIPVFHSWMGAGGGTATIQTVNALYKGHDRVVILTDEQAMRSAGVNSSIKKPIYTFNLAGYRAGHLPSNQDNRYTFGGGLSDTTFQVLKALDLHGQGKWPWE
jgi:hypothetical protein